MKSTFKVLFFLKRDKKKSDGTMPIMCRITIDGQMSRFGTKLSVNPNLWDVNTSAVLGRTKEAAEINTFLDTIKTSIYNVYHDLLTRENNVTPDRVKNIFLGLEVKNQTVLELYQRHMENPARVAPVRQVGVDPLNQNKIAPLSVPADGVIFILVYLFLPTFILRTLSPVSSI